MKDLLFGVIGAIGAGIASLFGGWSVGLIVLLSLMTLDYVTGWVVAAVFKKSKKTETGALSSKVGFIGIAKKGLILAIVGAACLLEKVTGTNYIRDLVIIYYVCNEILSIIENAGLMGVPIPKRLIAAVDVLKKQEEEKDVNELQHNSSQNDN